MNINELKQFEGKKVQLKSIYENTYIGIITEIDIENGLVSIKELIFAEVVFAIEEVKNVKLIIERVVVKSLDIIKVLEAQTKIRDEQAESKNFSLSQLSKLNKLIEGEGKYISTCLWDLMYFKINGLYINNNKVCYKSYDKASKKILKFLNENNDLIIKNFNYIIA